MMVYVAGSVPRSHQPGLSAIAAQVSFGLAAWDHATDAAPEEVVQGGTGLPSHEPR